MVFCVIFVFGTLLEFALLICLEKQIFDAQTKKSLTNLSMRRRTVKRGKEFNRNDSLIANQRVSGVPSCMMEQTRGSVDPGVEKLASGSPQLQHESKRNGINEKNGNITSSLCV